MNFREVRVTYILFDIFQSIHIQEEVYGIVLSIVWNEVWDNLICHLYDVLGCFLIIFPQFIFLTDIIGQIAHEPIAPSRKIFIGSI